MEHDPHQSCEPDDRDPVVAHQGEEPVHQAQQQGAEREDPAPAQVHGAVEPQVVAREPEVLAGAEVEQVAMHGMLGAREPDHQRVRHQLLLGARLGPEDREILRAQDAALGR